MACKGVEALTGVPVLVNTSFNVKGEPNRRNTARRRRVFSPPESTIGSARHADSKNAVHKIVGRCRRLYRRCDLGDGEHATGVNDLTISRLWWPRLRHRFILLF